MKSTTKLVRNLMVACCFMVLMLASVTVSAKNVYSLNGKTQTYKGAYYTVTYNGVAVHNANNPGILIKGNYMVPAKQTLALNGPKLAYSLKKKTVTLSYGGKTAKFYTNKKYMYVNGKKYKTDISAVKATVNGETSVYLPAKALKKAFGFGYTYSSAAKRIALTSPVVTASTSGVQAASLRYLTVAQFLSVVGPLAQKNYHESGILASVTLAQIINESGWARSALALASNNLFGMKISLSGNTWAGSVWDGKSYTSVVTTEQVKGKKVKVTCKFRKYPNISYSIADHSAYLNNAMNGLKKRYAGIAAAKTPSAQISILVSGGYCTWSSYKSSLLNLISKYNLTQWDK